MIDEKTLQAIVAACTQELTRQVESKLEWLDQIQMRKVYNQAIPKDSTPDEKARIEKAFCDAWSKMIATRLTEYQIILFFKETFTTLLKNPSLTRAEQALLETPVARALPSSQPESAPEKQVMRKPANVKPTLELKEVKGSQLLRKYLLLQEAFKCLHIDIKEVLKANSLEADATIDQLDPAKITVYLTPLQFEVLNDRHIKGVARYSYEGMIEADTQFYTWQKAYDPCFSYVVRDLRSERDACPMYECLVKANLDVPIPVFDITYCSNISPEVRFRLLECLFQFDEKYKNIQYTVKSPSSDTDTYKAWGFEVVPGTSQLVRSVKQVSKVIAETGMTLLTLLKKTQLTVEKLLLDSGCITQEMLEKKCNAFLGDVSANPEGFVQFCDIALEGLVIWGHGLSRFPSVDEKDVSLKPNPFRYYCEKAVKITLELVLKQVESTDLVEKFIRRNLRPKEAAELIDLYKVKGNRDALRDFLTKQNIDFQSWVLPGGPGTVGYEMESKSKTFKELLTEGLDPFALMARNLGEDDLMTYTMLYAEGGLERMLVEYGININGWVLPTAAINPHQSRPQSPESSSR